MNNKHKQLEKLKCLFEEYLRLLREHKGGAYTSSIKGLLGILYDETCTIENRIQEVREIFKGMMGGPGTLGDFAIWHEDIETQLELNQYLDKIEERMWEILTAELPELPDVDEGYPPEHRY